MTKVSRVDMAGRNTLCMGHQGQIPFDGPPVSDTLVGSHQCQHPSNLASITAFYHTNFVNSPSLVLSPFTVTGTTLPWHGAETPVE